MKKNLIILGILILFLLLILWLAADCSREFNTKKQNIKSIKIYDEKLIQKIIASQNVNNSNNLTINEVLMQSIVMNISKKNEIEEFLNSIHPVYFNFQLIGCRCNGDYKIIFIYHDNTEYSFEFAFAQIDVIKMPGYRDWQIGEQMKSWLRKKVD